MNVRLQAILHLPKPKFKTNFPSVIGSEKRENLINGIVQLSFITMDSRNSGIDTVKLDFKELLIKEQIDFKELLTDYQLFYTINLL